MPALRKTGIEWRGPYNHVYGDGRPDCWRVERVDFDTRDAKNKALVSIEFLKRAEYPTLKDAEGYLADWKAREQDKKRITWRQAIDLYEYHKRPPKGHPDYEKRMRSLATTLAHLRSFFVDINDRACGSLKPDKVRVLYTGEVVPGLDGPEVKEHGLVTRPTRYGDVPSADTQRNTLSEVKTFVRWLGERSHLGREVVEAFDRVKPEGRRNKGGKGQCKLAVPQIIAFIEKAKEIALDEARPAEERERGACALFIVLTGQRASEVTGTKAKDIVTTGGKNHWWVQVTKERAKTPAALRLNFIGSQLRPVMAPYVLGKEWEQYVFGADAECSKPHWRNWAKESIALVCREAKLPRQTAHQMRGANHDIFEMIDAKDLDKHFGHTPGSTTGARSYRGVAGKEAAARGVDASVERRLKLVVG